MYIPNPLFDKCREIIGFYVNNRIDVMIKTLSLLKVFILNFYIKTTLNYSPLD